MTVVEQILFLALVLTAATYAIVTMMQRAELLQELKRHNAFLSEISAFLKQIVSEMKRSKK